VIQGRGIAHLVGGKIACSACEKKEMAARRAEDERANLTCYHYFTKVMGVSRNNANGCSRQRILAGCNQWEKLSLFHEENNPVDKNAVQVLRGDGQQIGYLDARLAADIIKRSEQKTRFAVFVSNITGGTRTKPLMGCNLLIVEVPDGLTDQDAQRYTNTITLESDE
jgi:hypothetical protein